MNNRYIKDFFDRRAAQWDESGAEDAEKLRGILMLAGIEPGCRVLDVACGTGVLFPLYLSMGVAHITGMDISDGMIAKAREKFSDARIKLIVGDAENKSLQETFDRCVIYNAFPHFMNPIRLFDNMASMLTTGARLTVAHGRGRQAINAQHVRRAEMVSVDLVPAPMLIEWMSPWFTVDIAIDAPERYVVSGLRREATV